MVWTLDSSKHASIQTNKQKCQHTKKNLFCFLFIISMFMHKNDVSIRCSNGNLCFFGLKIRIKQLRVVVFNRVAQVISATKFQVLCIGGHPFSRFRSADIGRMLRQAWREPHCTSRIGQRIHPLHLSFPNGGYKSVSVWGWGKNGTDYSCQASHGFNLNHWKIFSSSYMWNKIRILFSTCYTLSTFP